MVTALNRFALRDIDAEVIRDWTWGNCTWQRTTVFSERFFPAVVITSERKQIQV